MAVEVKRTGYNFRSSPMCRTPALISSLSIWSLTHFLLSFVLTLCCSFIFLKPSCEIGELCCKTPNQERGYTVQLSTVVYNVICTFILDLCWTLLQVMNLQCHVIRRAQWRLTIKCSLGEEWASVSLFSSSDDWGHLYYYHRDVSDILYVCLSVPVHV